MEKKYACTNNDAKQDDKNKKNNMNKNKISFQHTLLCESTHGY